MQVSRLRHAYVATAVVVFNVVILFTALNLVAATYLGIRGRLPPGNTALAHASTYGISLERLASLYPGLSRADISRLLQETWVDNPLIFEPFTLFKERPRTGRFVNVRTAGFRAGLGAGQPWPPDRAAGTTVFVFGGSTTFGYGVQDEETVVSHLQRLADAHPGAKPTRFYNFGRGFYFLTHERILLQQLLSAGIVPDTVVFVDGLNDFAFPAGEPAGAGRFRGALESTRTLSDMLTGTLHTLPVTKAALRALEKFGGTGSDGAENTPPQQASTGPDGDRLIRSVLTRYAADRKLVEATAAAYGINVFFVWQPVPAYKYDLRHHLFAKNGMVGPSHVLSGPGYVAMAKVWPSEPNSIWCADIQAGLTEPLYVDPTHYSGAMNRQLAECIAKGMARP